MLPARNSYLVWTNAWLTWIFTAHNWGASRVNSLYFVEVKADGNSFYTIGIRTRLIEEWIAEVQRDVRAHYSDVTVNLLGLWEHWGNVELYFKHHSKRLIIASRNWRSISCFPMSSAPYGICWKWKQKCPVMLSGMCGFGVSAIVKQQPRRTPPPISNSASGNCGAFLNAPKRMGTLNQSLSGSTVLHKSF